MSLNSCGSCSCPCHYLIGWYTSSLRCQCQCSGDSLFNITYTSPNVCDAIVHDKTDIEVLREEIKILQNHHIRQIDENRKMSRRVDELENNLKAQLNKLAEFGFTLEKMRSECYEILRQAKSIDSQKIEDLEILLFHIQRGISEWADK